MSTSSEFEFPRVTVPCRTCGVACVRSALDGSWVHADDHYRIRGTTVQTDYDHEPALRIIKARLHNDKSAESPPNPGNRPGESPGDPFRHVTFDQ